ncbi:MAG: hypothetical protein JWP68_1879, partial [Modestobacter sp.]|nr:hypothetical protein [Modestobacter sp.]
WQDDAIGVALVMPEPDRLVTPRRSRRPQASRRPAQGVDERPGIGGSSTRQPDRRGRQRHTQPHSSAAFLVEQPLPGVPVSSSAVSTPAPAQRLRSAASSPVRDLLALLDRPEVISFAAFAVRAHRGQSRPAGARRPADDAPRVAHERRRPAGHRRFAAGAHAHRDGPAVLPARRCPRRPGGRGRRRHRPRRAGRRPRARAADAAPPGPDLRQPDRPHADARAPGGRRRARRPTRRLGGRGRPVRRAALPRHPRPGAGRSAGCGGARAAPGQLLHDRLPGHAAGLAAAAGLPDARADRGQQAADLHTSTIDQVAAAAYLGAGDLDAHVRRSPRGWPGCGRRCSAEGDRVSGRRARSRRRGRRAPGGPTRPVPLAGPPGRRRGRPAPRR